MLTSIVYFDKIVSKHMKITIAGHPDLDMRYFTEARRLISTAASINDLSPFYHRAYNVLRSSTFGSTKLVPWKGFQYTPPGGSDAESIHMEGITKVIEVLFHPIKLDVATGGHQTGGSARGCKVDDEIAALVNEGRPPESGTLHRYTILTLKRLYEEKLMPFAAQFAAAMPSIGIATAADILCIDRLGMICNVQLKTGFERDYDKPSKMGMRMFSPHVACMPLTDMVDSHKNRHRIQLIVEHAIFSRIVDESVVLVVSSTHTDIHRVDRDISLMTGIIENIRARHRTRVQDQDTDLKLRIAALKKSYAIKKVHQKRRFIPNLHKVKKEKK